jgi:glycosyltransferase involved in cell wall biosynthesis
MTRALLVSLSAPEMDRLAVELAARKSLVGVVRRYVNKHRWWERALAGTPRFGGIYASTLGRRVPPAGLDTSLVIEAGVAADVAAAITSRIGRRFPGFQNRYGSGLLKSAELGVANVAGRHVTRADVVVGSYHVALPAFRQARASGRKTVLNYPIAHHRWQYRFYAEQARKFPQFAAALPQFGSMEEHAAALDPEIELADLILVGSGFVRDSFLAEGVPSEKIRVIPYGADSQRFTPLPEPRRNPDPFRLLFVGQIGERKGISHLLNAYRMFRKKDTELHIVGNYAPGREVYAGYRDLYRHTANVAQKQLPDLMRAADVFVFPTLVEGMPMVVLEAMACGLPVIVTPNGPGDVVRDGVDGFIVPPGDSAAIVERLERLYSDADLRLEMGRNARQQAEKWSWSRYATSAAETVLGMQRAPKRPM